MASFDFLKGILRWQSETSLTTQNFLSYLGAFLVLAPILLILFLLLFSPEHGLFNEAVYQIAGLMNALEIPAEGRHFSYYGGDELLLKAPVASLRSLPTLVENHARMVPLFWIGFALSSVLSVFVLYAISTFVSFSGTQKKADKKSFIRGAELVESSALKRHIVEQGEVSDLYLGNVPFVRSLQSRHLGVFGDTGTGKSQLIFSILHRLREQGKKLFIVDKSGEFVQHFYNPETDILLGPFDDRTHGWTPYNEGAELFDCERLAKSFIPTSPEKHSGQDHWPEAALTVFSWLLKQMVSSGKNLTIEDLIHQLTVSRDVVHTDALGNEKIVRIRGINELLKGTLAELVIDPDSPDHAASVIATIIPKIRALWYLRGLEHKPSFSFRDWVKNPDAGSVFIRVTEDQLDSVNPIVSAWIDTVIKTVLSLEKDPDRELWAFIDELQSFDKINTLGKGVYEGRKYGLRFVLGFTSVQELFSLYGQHTAKSIISMLCTKAVFRTSEPDGAEWNSRLLGEEEFWEKSQHVNYSGHAKSSSLSEGDQRKRLSLVSGTEIAALEDLNFYLKFSGPWPLAKVRESYREWAKLAAPFVPRTLPKEMSHKEENQVYNSPSALMAESEDEPLL
jgi:type IV secretory pathway TraG/TraD family ATPase VirD4